MDTSDLAGGFAVVKNIVSVLGILVLLIALGLDARRTHHPQSA
jgi:hypothetical protein